MRTVDAHRIENLLQMCGSYHGVIAYDTVIAVLHDVPTIEPQQWIPVGERLPEQEGAYLVTKTRWGHTWLSVEYFLPGSGWDVGPESTVEPTAWQPLPEPWKGENDG